MPNSSTQIALGDLFDMLTQIGARELVQDIKQELTRGVLVEVEVKKGHEESRRPYNPDESYIVAVQMLLAAIDPALMADSARRILGDITQQVVSLDWRPDSLEGADQITRPDEQPIAIPTMPDADAHNLRAAAELVSRLVANLRRSE